MMHLNHADVKFPEKMTQVVTSNFRRKEEPQQFIGDWTTNVITVKWTEFYVPLRSH